MFLPCPWLRGLEGGRERLRIVLDWRDPAVARVLRLMVPVTLGLGLINVNALIDTFFASRLIDPISWPTAIQKAFLVYMLAAGDVLGRRGDGAVPDALAARVARRPGRFRDAVASGLRQIAFLLAPTAAFSAVLATPIIRLLYEHGALGRPLDPVTACALAAFSAGLVFNGGMLLLNCAFFSLQSTGCRRSSRSATSS